MVLDYLSNTLQRYEKILNYANIFPSFFKFSLMLIALHYPAIIVAYFPTFPLICLEVSELCFIFADE